MKKDLLDRIPEGILRKLAEDKGHLFRPGESIEEIRKWLLTYYRKGVDEIFEKGGSVLEMANETVRKVRSMVGIPTQEPWEKKETPSASGQDAFETETMAKIYEKQGLMDEAAAVYEKLLQGDTDNVQWRKALDRLIGESEKIETKKNSCEEEIEEKVAAPSVGANTISAAHVTRKEPCFLLDMEDLPAKYGRDGMILMAVGPDELYTYWEVTQQNVEDTAREAGADKTLVLRVFEVNFDDSGQVETTVKDESVQYLVGEYFIHGVKPGGFYRSALGVKAGPKFYPLAHSALEATPQTGQGELMEKEWMELDQKALLWRSRAVEPLSVDMPVKLSLREKALLRLHALGKSEGSRISGISKERLDELFGSISDLQKKIVREDVSSPGFGSSG